MTEQVSRPIALALCVRAELLEGLILLISSITLSSSATTSHPRQYLFISSSSCSTMANLPIHEAVVQGRLDEVKRLILGNSALLEARTNNSMPIPGARCLLDLQSTPLLIAAATNDGRMLEWLIDQGADIQARNDYGNDALLLAAYNNNINTVDILLHRCFNVEESRDQYDYTPLIWA